jgi:two-component system, NarL family, response regulator NreC
MGIRILIAEDHALLREAIGFRLKAEPDLEIVGEAEDGRVATCLARELNPDIVIMDVNMPNLNGIEATRQIRRDQPATKVVAYSEAVDRHSVQEMLTAGASGYVLKSCPFEELLTAIRQVAANHTYLAPRVCTLVIDGYVNDVSDGGNHSGPNLTGREREILQSIAEGKSTKMIAGELSLSPKTIEWHRNRLMKKLGIENVVGLVRYALAQGLTSVDLASAGVP